MAHKDICIHDECTGCMACINVCNSNAIEFQIDSLGFKYPKINSDKCVQCGLCTKICPQNNPRNFIFPEQCYAAAVNDQLLLNTCASGGVATALSMQVIQTGGIVVGCSGEDIHNVRHIIVESLGDLQKIKGSKYVQSHIPKNLFQQIKTYLIEGRRVIFFGTGCQTAGLQSFLRKEYDNLIVVDLVCHGISSQKLLSEDLLSYTHIDKHSISFRHKIKHKPFIRYSLSANNTKTGKSISIPWYKDPYLGAFMASVSFRKGCYQCQYAQTKRQSDITLCDFWGLGQDSRLSNSKGVSAVLISNRKGKQLFESVRHLLVFEERSLEEAVRGNGQLQEPSKMPTFRSDFVKLYTEHGINAAYKKTTYRFMRNKYLRQQIPSSIFKIYAKFRKLLQ